MVQCVYTGPHPCESSLMDVPPPQRATALSTGSYCTSLGLCGNSLALLNAPRMLSQPSLTLLPAGEASFNPLGHFSVVLSLLHSVGLHASLDSEPTSPPVQMLLPILLLGKCFCLI